MKIHQLNIFATFLLLKTLLNTVTSRVNLESLFTNCREGENNNIDTCLKGFLDSIRPYYTTGIPELNVPVLDPIYLENIKFRRQDGVIDLRAAFSEVLGYGYANSTLMSLKTNVNQRTLQSMTVIPKLRVTGTYDLRGRVFLFPISGKDQFTLQLDNIEALLKSNIITRRNNGTEALGIQNTSVKLKFGKSRVKLFNLFNGNKLLSDTVNHFINDNNRLIFNEVEHEVEKNLASLIELTLEKALSKIPLSLFRKQLNVNL